MKRPYFRRTGGLLLPYLALVLIHLLSGVQMEQPLILADEAGYLGNARYLSGAAHLPDMRGTGFYHFGYSLFLLPAFWLFSEPVAIYKAVIAINSLLISALFFPLYVILESLLQVPARWARWFAFTCCLYPSLVLYSNVAWSENAFVPFYALATLLFGKYLVSRSTRDMALFSLVAGFLYTIHPRALPVVAAVVVYLILLAAVRAISVRQCLLGSSTMAIVLVGTRLVNEHLKAIAWGGGGELYATKLAGRLVPGADFPALLERAAGQGLYMALASHGLVLVGIMAMIWVIVENLRQRPLREVLARPRTAVPLFVLVTGGSILAAASTLKLYAVHGAHGLRGADFIHGRYNEALSVVAIAFALAECSRKGLPSRQTVWRVVAVSAVIVCLAAVVVAEVDDALKRHVAGVPGVQPEETVLPSAVDAVAVPGVYPLVGLFGGLKLYAISFAVIGSFILVSLAMRLSRRGGAVLLMLLFSFFSYYNHRHYLLPRAERVKGRLAFAAQVRRIGNVATISYDAAHREPGFIPAVQFLLQDTVFRRFDSRRGEEPASEAVISGDDWSQANRLGARFVISSGRGSALWLLPGAKQSRLGPADYAGVLLGAAQRLDAAGERLLSPGELQRRAGALDGRQRQLESPARSAKSAAVAGGRDPGSRAGRDPSPDPGERGRAVAPTGAARDMVEEIQPGGGTARGGAARRAQQRHLQPRRHAVVVEGRATPGRRGDRDPADGGRRLRERSGPMTSLLFSPASSRNAVAVCRWSALRPRSPQAYSKYAEDGRPSKVQHLRADTALQ